MTRPSVLVYAPNPFADPSTATFESGFCLKMRSGHLASFGNLVRSFTGIHPPMENRWREVRPLAGYYLESFLKVRGFRAAAVFDAAGLAARGRSFAPDVVALSTTFITDVPTLVAALRAIRAALGDERPVVVGGPFVWKESQAQGDPAAARLFSPDAHPLLRDAVFVASEFGEHTLLCLLGALGDGHRGAADLASLPNLVIPDGHGWRQTTVAAEPVDLERDFTRWDLVDEMPGVAVPVRTSVGCPYECEFCDFVAVHPRLRVRSTRSLVEELELVAARGAASVVFVDDNAFSTARRTEQLGRALVERDLGLRWGGYLRADSVTNDNAELLSRAGLHYAWCGVESGDPAMLERMNKRCDLSAAGLGMDLLTGMGAYVLATFVLGFPGETEASVDRTIEFLNARRRDQRGRIEYAVFPFVLTPGAPVDRPEQRRRYGLVGSLGDWRHDTMTSEAVRRVFAPRVFAGAEPSYAYYGGDDSPLWTPQRRNDAVAARKDVTLAFLQGADDDHVQARFAGLHRVLRFGPGETPPWASHLAPRREQPSIAGAAPGPGELPAHG